MIAQFGACRVELVEGDITEQKVDAIVNAANSRLAGGSGVDGAIHRAAGGVLMEETRRLYPNGCPTGEAVPTTAGNLDAKFVFHAVGPVWRGGLTGEGQSLAGVFQRCLELAVEHECNSIAFPAISTGVYGYPVDRAAETSLAAIRDFCAAENKPSMIRVVLFDGGTYGAFARVLEGMTD